MTATDEYTTERIEFERGDVLYDSESGEEHAVIVDIDAAGVTLRQGDTERFVPHALFAPWNDAGLVSKPKAREQRRFRPPSVSHGRAANDSGEREGSESTNESVESVQCRRL